MTSRSTDSWSKPENIHYNFPGERVDATQTSMRLPAQISNGITNFLCAAMPNAARDAGVPCCVGDAYDVCDDAFSLRHGGLSPRLTESPPLKFPKGAGLPMKLR
jgi:hypothetical protein